MAVKCIRLTAEIFYGFSVFTFAFNAVVIPQLIEHKVCRNKYNSSVCIHLNKHPEVDDDVQENAAEWLSVLPLSALLPAFFTILMIGPISDVVGKRTTMKVPPLVYMIQSSIYIAMTRIKVPFSPGFFIIPYCLSGVFGDNAGCASLAEAYISCITLRKDRTFRMAVLESAIFFGSFFAAVSSGVLLTYFGFTGAFCMTGVVNLLNFLYVIFVLPSEKTLLPELSNESEQNQDDATANSTLSHNKNGDGRLGNKRDMTVREMIKPWRCIKQIGNAICARNRRKLITATIILFSISLFVNMGEIYFGILFIKNRPFNLKAKGIGYIVATQAILRVGGVLVIPYVCQRFLKFKDIHLAMLGFTTQTVYFLSFGFASSVLTLYLIQIIGIPLSVHQPVFRSMISKSVDAHQYGAAISAAEAVDIASSLLTSLISNQVYSATFPIFRGFTMCLLGVLAFLGLIGAVAFSFAFRGDLKPTHNEEQQSLLTD